MNDTELNLRELKSQASRQQAEALIRLIVAGGRLLARPFRRAPRHAT